MICFLCHMHFSFFVRCIFHFFQIHLSSFFLPICLNSSSPCALVGRNEADRFLPCESKNSFSFWNLDNFFSSIFHCRKLGNPINVKQIKAELCSRSICGRCFCRFLLYFLFFIVVDRDQRWSMISINLWKCKLGLCWPLSQSWRNTTDESLNLSNTTFTPC